MNISKEVFEDLREMSQDGLDLIVKLEGANLANEQV